MRMGNLLRTHVSMSVTFLCLLLHSSVLRQLHSSAPVHTEVLRAAWDIVTDDKLETTRLRRQV